MDQQQPKRVAVFTHHYRDDTESAIAAVRERAQRGECELFFDRFETARHEVKAGPGVVIDADLDSQAVDLALVFGGDGSVLRSLRQFAGRDVPTFGFNFGRIGFLATAEKSDLPARLDTALAGDFQVVSMPALRVRFDGVELLAINDVSFQRPRDARVAELEYQFAGVEVGRVRCDGLVVATPAGSTGYNLANSGPILAWGVAGYVVSFIAPHTLTARALVASPDDVLEVKNMSGSDQVDVLIDGRPVGLLEVGAGAQIEFADSVALLAQLPGDSFYHRIREKFGKLAT